MSPKRVLTTNRMLVTGNIPVGVTLVLKVAAYEGGARLDKCALRLGKGLEEVAVDIDHANDLLMDEDRHDNFRFRQVHHREVARIAGDIVHHDGSAAGNRCAAQSLVDRNAELRTETAGIRSQDQHLGVGGAQQEKADPAIAGGFLMKAVGDLVHEGFGAVRGQSQRVEFFQEVLMFEHSSPLYCRSGGGATLLSSIGKSS